MAKRERAWSRYEILSDDEERALRARRRDAVLSSDYQQRMRAEGYPNLGKARGSGRVGDTPEVAQR